MIGLNIALNFTFKDMNAKFIDLNSKILKNRINFDYNHIPHLTILQFFTNESNINKIQTEIDNLNITNLKDLKFTLTYDKDEHNNYIYKYSTESDELITLNKNLIKKVERYIKTLDKESDDIFAEKINYINLFNLVNNYSKKIYQPHITLGISDQFSNINSDDFIINNCNIKLELFKIGDYGTAIPLITSLFFCHRINLKSELSKIDNNYGIEIDLRDEDEMIIIEHDPFKSGENFENYLENYSHNGIILNIKSERIEYKILDLLKKYKINNYFFLDCSFPMIYQLNKLGEKNIAIRFSEYESIETVMLVQDMVKWVWVDCFNNFPLDQYAYKKIKEAGLKICLVSPELQNHSLEKIEKFRKIIIKNNFKIDAICTKSYNIEKWL